MVQFGHLWAWKCRCLLFIAEFRSHVVALCLFCTPGYHSDGPFPKPGELSTRKLIVFTILGGFKLRLHQTSMWPLESRYLLPFQADEIRFGSGWDEFHTWWRCRFEMVVVANPWFPGHGLSDETVKLLERSGNSMVTSWGNSTYTVSISIYIFLICTTSISGGFSMPLLVSMQVEWFLWVAPESLGWTSKPLRQRSESCPRITLQFSSSTWRRSCLAHPFNLLGLLGVKMSQVHHLSGSCSLNQPQHEMIYPLFLYLSIGLNQPMRWF